jgi:hypothetical protein
MGAGYGGSMNVVVQRFEIAAAGTRCNMPAVTVLMTAEQIFGCSCLCLVELSHRLQPAGLKCEPDAT